MWEKPCRIKGHTIREKKKQIQRIYAEEEVPIGIENIFIL